MILLRVGVFLFAQDKVLLQKIFLPIPSERVQVFAACLSFGYLHIKTAEVLPTTSQRPLRALLELVLLNGVQRGRFPNEMLHR